ncbi:D-glycero-beta-D-manno-heptose 1-phosphate adenylyltransferase [Salinibacter ruber]|uniref:D-glycero-beta-D-manno-heptose 1-phosphate adenylyltransferase n=1 Tax=Salinibacter ruber TaxID=146919 RepID=UPI002168A4F0|nr:D-glycero-beta-D-manno-heptose 1-phosphate adenylyltransferase [Salinibacter ruber]MCS4136410.1 D-beta-D-heptose 7-phosphate kinase/D-beta-D-heptose 1-phosphate adenosyltransferase [Salinibacter ruber]
MDGGLSLPSFDDVSALVVGDFMLDKYFSGQVERVSPEAPVPVVNASTEEFRAGGAGNVAVGLRNLGCDVTVAGLVGKDTPGERLNTLLEESGIDTGGLVSPDGRPTTLKIRLISDQQHIARIDREDDSKCSVDGESDILSFLDSELGSRVDVIVVSDYLKGAVTERIFEKCAKISKRLDIPCVVDPKGESFEKYAGATVITPNRLELKNALQHVGKDKEGAHLAERGQELIRDLNIEKMALTCGDEGIYLIDKEGCHHEPAKPQEVYDVSGAGDAVTATLGAALGAGVSHLDSVRLAKYAGGGVVEKMGTVPVDRGLIERQLTRFDGVPSLIEESSVYGSTELAPIVEDWKDVGEKVVFTNGCFDIIHVGHVSYLYEAKNLGSKLVVALNSDESVRHLKGDGRPVVSESERASIIASLECVDAVSIFGEDTPLSLIETIKPDVVAKGGDYDEDEIVGHRAVKKWGGEVASLSYVEGISSSKIIEQLQGKHESK